NKLLLEGGASYMMGGWPYPSPGDGFSRVDPNDISILELSTNFRYNARAFYQSVVDQDRYAQRFSAAYVTGSHAIKTGIQVEELVVNQDRVVHGDVTYAFLRGVPNTITQYGTPYLQKDRATDLGVFVQDQWTVKRLTLNYGLRFDYFNGHTPPQAALAGRFLPAREFAAV